MEINGIMPGIEAVAVRLLAQTISDPGLTSRQSAGAISLIESSSANPGRSTAYNRQLDENSSSTFSQAADDMP